MPPLEHQKGTHSIPFILHYSPLDPFHPSLFTLSIPYILCYSLTRSPTSFIIHSLLSSYLHEVLEPLSYGYSIIFKCPETISKYINIPAAFATGFGFIFSYGKLLHSMVGSNLLPFPAIKFGNGDNNGTHLRAHLRTYLRTHVLIHLLRCE